MTMNEYRLSVEYLRATERMLCFYYMAHFSKRRNADLVERMRKGVIEMIEFIGKDAAFKTRTEGDVLIAPRTFDVIEVAAKGNVPDVETALWQWLETAAAMDTNLIVE